MKCESTAENKKNCSKEAVYNVELIEIKTFSWGSALNYCEEHAKIFLDDSAFKIKKLRENKDNAEMS